MNPLAALVHMVAPQSQSPFTEVTSALMVDVDSVSTTLAVRRSGGPAGPSGYNWADWSASVRFVGGRFMII